MKEVHDQIQRDPFEAWILMRTADNQTFEEFCEEWRNVIAGRGKYQDA